MTPRRTALLTGGIVLIVLVGLVVVWSVVTLRSRPADPVAGPSSVVQAPSAAAAKKPAAPGVQLPRASQTLAKDTLVWRHRAEDSWSIATVTTSGQTGAELVVGSRNVGAVLSHDRRTVLYLRHQDGDRSSLRAVSADGRDDRQLFSDGSTDCPKLRRPAFSAKGTLAVVCSAYDEGDPDVLNIMTLDGHLVRRLDTGQLGDATFSPDGSMLVYSRDRYASYVYGGALFSVPVDGSASPTRVAAGTNANPVWSPTSDEVAFVRYDGKRKRIMAVRVSPGGQGGVRALTTGDLVDQDPSWSPDGKQIAFRRGDDEPHLFVMKTSGDGVRRLVKDPGPVTAPAWTAR